MRSASSYAIFGALAPYVAAFPAAVMEAAARDPMIQARTEQLTKMLGSRQAGAGVATTINEPVPIFNAKAQLVDVSAGSGHEFVPPSGSDLRGPCPGLNAMANHNFLPHDGWATIAQFIDATNSVVGMGVDLATFLAVFGAVIDGSGTAWSIGGSPTLAEAGTVLGGNGISGSHNKYESDASPTRPDLYEAGNDYLTVPAQFQQLIDASPGSVTMDSLTEFRSQRFDAQIANNPYFFNGPFTGVAVQPAAYTFIYRFMANHSEANPYGLLDYDVIKSWFAISGNSGSYTVQQGWERIPENWYKRAIEYPYSLTYFQQDLVAAALLHPKFLSVGGNTGTTNSFTGVDINNLTGGVYNAQSLTQGDNAACFAFQFAAQAKPDVALPLISTLTSALGSITGQLACPQLRAIDDAQLQQFPGYTKNPAF
ncbi:hypothetical protein LTR62_001136 [Meristemomyces frigidus]|uniref:Heme haloperoxidase family profile domain-containing protein n=1 Tax=Meristemomyces frigidus TaxID=1508187 RepID=A0AAN7THE0_9PEZI|nr:hypothetical protein LTR62_001136 [Meristemomyces frigidus]